MAVVIRVKRLEIIEGELDLPMPTAGTVYGVVRLWYEQPSPPAPPGVPATRSDKCLVIGEDIGPTSGPPSQRYGEAIRLGHLQRLDGGYQKLLADRGLTLEDYTQNRNFVADLAVPATLIDAYTG